MQSWEIDFDNTTTLDQEIAFLESLQDICLFCDNSLKRCLLPEECGNWENHDCGLHCNTQ